MSEAIFCDEMVILMYNVQQLINPEDNQGDQLGVKLSLKY